MKFLPFENYILSTSYTIEEAQRRLLENLEPERSWTYFMRNDTKPYKGKITENRFSISRIIRYRNSFLPVITGKFSTKKGQTEINIRMRLHLFTLIFMSFWLGMVGIFCIILIVSTLINVGHLFKQEFSPMVLIPFGMFIFGYSLITVAFKAESNKSKKFLAQLFENNIAGY